VWSRKTLYSSVLFFNAEPMTTETVQRLPDSPAKWITQRDHLAHVLSKSPKLTIHASSEWHASRLRECVGKLQREGYGPETEVVVGVGQPDPESLGGWTCKTVDPWTGEVR
jgi:hypothetical protein